MNKDPGQTFSVDHYIDTFVVKIRSLSGVGPEDLKNLIEKKFEVVDIKKTKTETPVIYPGVSDDLA